MFAAAGNDGGTTTCYPAGYDNVIGVGATDANDNRASFSNHNSNVDLTAPGVAILSDLPKYHGDLDDQTGDTDFDFLLHRYFPNDPTKHPWYIADMTGTSMSCAFASGLAALVLSMKPDLKTKPGDVETLMENNADQHTGYPAHQRNDEYGFGRMMPTRPSCLLSPHPPCVPLTPPSGITPVV